jgi:putative ABC transport system permease protein
MNALWSDLRYACRTLAKRPGFTAVAVMTLGLGIGANTAVFSVVDAVLVRPLPFPDPDRLVVVFDTQPTLETAPASFPDFSDWRGQNRVFEEMTAYYSRSLNLVGRNEPERVRCAQVSENYFALFGVRPAIGRGFSAADHQPGAAPVVVVSHGFWQRHTGGDPDLIGRSILLDDVSYTVTGVLPPDAPSLSQTPAEVWMPLEPHVPWEERGTHFLTVVARLGQGISLERAQADMDAIATRIDEEHHTNHGIRLVPLHEQLVGGTRASLMMLYAAGTLMLLIALANVANLLLARASGRTREFAIRTALGASRLRLARQMLTESILLALLGGAAGTVLALWATDLIVAQWPANVRRPPHIGIDWRVLGFTAALSLAAGLVFGLAPALRAAATNLSESLKESATAVTGTRATRRIRNLAVISEMALATVLLLGAGLMLRSYWHVQGVDPGFRPENVLSVQISLPPSKYGDGARRAAFFREVLGRIAALPNVQSVGAINNLPLGGGGMNGDFQVEGQSFPSGQEPNTEKYIVSPDYFRAMGIPLRSGRLFSESDAESRPEVVIINEAISRRFWPNEDPIGRRLSWGSEWKTIVGVVGDVKHEALDRPSGFESYVPYSQLPSSGMTIVARTASDPVALTVAVKSEIFAVDPHQPVSRVNTLNRIVADSIAGRRLPALVLGVLAVVAVMLAAVGIYAVMADSTAQRTHEFGVRMALGAPPADVLGLVMRQALKITLVSVAIGLVAALALARLVSGLLYGVGATDPFTYAIVATLLAAVALLASYVPARRAMRVDPMVALRYE